MLKIGNTEITTSSTVIKNGTDVTKVDKDGTVVWQKQTGEWAFSGSLTLQTSNGLPPLIIETDKNKFRLKQGNSVGGWITFDGTNFSGESRINYQYADDISSATFTIPNFGLTAYGNGLGFNSINKITYNSQTQKFTGSIVAMDEPYYESPTWGYFCVTVEFFATAVENDLGILIQFTDIYNTAAILEAVGLEHTSLKCI